MVDVEGVVLGRGGFVFDSSIFLSRFLGMGLLASK